MCDSIYPGILKYHSNCTIQVALDSWLEILNSCVVFSLEEGIILIEFIFVQSLDSKPV